MINIDDDLDFMPDTRFDPQAKEPICPPIPPCPPVPPIPPVPPCPPYPPFPPVPPVPPCPPEPPVPFCKSDYFKGAFATCIIIKFLKANGEKDLAQIKCYINKMFKKQGIKPMALKEVNCLVKMLVRQKLVIRKKDGKYMYNWV